MEGHKLMTLALKKMLEVLVVCIGAVIIDSLENCIKACIYYFRIN